MTSIRRFFTHEPRGSVYVISKDKTKPVYIERVSVRGRVTPADALDANKWRFYATENIPTITGGKPTTLEAALQWVTIINTLPKTHVTWKETYESHSRWARKLKNLDLLSQ